VSLSRLINREAAAPFLLTLHLVALTMGYAGKGFAVCASIYIVLL